MPNHLLIILSWLSLAVGFGSTGWILVDIYLRGYRLKMPIMEAVWPITGLYFGPVAIWGYRRFGRPTSTQWQCPHDWV